MNIKSCQFLKELNCKVENIFVRNQHSRVCLTNSAEPSRHIISYCFTPYLDELWKATLRSIVKVEETKVEADNFIL